MTHDVPVAGARPLGCFRDTGDRDLRTAWIHSARMTRQMCNRFCRIMVSTI